MSEPNVLPKALEDVGIQEKLGADLSAVKVSFKNEFGNVVHWPDLMKSGRPTLLTFVYFGCPGLCTMVLNSLTDGLKTLKLGVGNDYQVVSVSIDSKEDSTLARDKKEAYLKDFAGSPKLRENWHFLTGDEGSIAALTQAAGFKFRYEPKEKQFAHGAGVFVLTPHGTLSRVIHGINYTDRNLRMAVVEAGSGKIGTLVDRFLMFCYRYDAATRKYSLVATNLVKAASVLVLFIFGGYLAIFWFRQRMRVQRQCG